MNCAVCGAPLPKGTAPCGICGRARQADSTRPWDRTVEAAAFQDLKQALGEDEALLGVTRGRLIGRIRSGFSLSSASVLLSPYANLGLTGKRLLVQPVRPSTGAASRQPASIPIEEIRAIGVTDADPLAEGRTARMEVHLANGESFRLRASGRLAHAARELGQVWKSLCARPNGAQASSVLTCVHCGRETDQLYRFCPFCGKEQEAAEDV